MEHGVPDHKHEERSFIFVADLVVAFYRVLQIASENRWPKNMKLINGVSCSTGKIKQ